MDRVPWYEISSRLLASKAKFSTKQCAKNAMVVERKTSAIAVWLFIEEKCRSNAETYLHVSFFIVGLPFKNLTEPYICAILKKKTNAGPDTKPVIEFFRSTNIKSP